MTNDHRRCITCTIEKTVVCFYRLSFSFFFSSFCIYGVLGLLFLDGLLHLRRYTRFCSLERFCLFRNWILVMPSTGWKTFIVSFQFYALTD
jgi:hypothetical protein